MSSTYEEPLIRCSGGYVVYVELCRGINLECNKYVHALYYLIKEGIRGGEVVGISELVPAYSSLTIFYDPNQVDSSKLINYVRSVWRYVREVGTSELVRPTKYRVPVAYGGEYGPDLEEVAELTGLSTEEVIKLHTSREYVCFMLGFTPGFLYLGEVDDRIAVPRLPSPRSRVPKGSVGIAGKQTGIYGTEAPGGWRLIGRTPVTTFDPRKEPPTPIKPGDLITFYPISHEDFRRFEGVFISECRGS